MSHDSTQGKDTAHLYKPRFQLVVDDDVIPIALKTVLVIVHDRLLRKKVSFMQLYNYTDTQMKE